MKSSFISAEVILAGGVISFFVGVRQVFSAAPNARRWVGLATAIGIATSLLLVGAALTPANRFLSVHLEMVTIASWGASLAAVLCVFAVVRDRRFPRSSLVAAILVAGVLGGYAGVIQWGPMVDSLYGLMFQVTAQKITFAVLLAGIAYLSVVGERLSTAA